MCHLVTPGAETYRTLKESSSLYIQLIAKPSLWTWRSLGASKGKVFFSFPCNSGACEMRLSSTCVWIGLLYCPLSHKTSSSLQLVTLKWALITCVTRTGHVQFICSQHIYHKQNKGSYSIDFNNNLFLVMN